MSVHFDAPLHVGTGQRLSPATDAPVLRDPDGRLWLPGSSVRGVLRDWCEREASRLGVGNDVVGRLFGTPGAPESRNSRGKIVRAADPDRQGRLTVFDAALSDAIGGLDSDVRDHVRISEDWGAAERGGKFDQEVGVAREGIIRVLYEGTGPDDPELALLKCALDALAAGLLAFGGNSGSGFGFSRTTKTETAVEDRRDFVGLSGYLTRRLTANAPTMDATIWGTAVLGSRPHVTGEPRPWSWLALELSLQFDGPMLTAALDRGLPQDSTLTPGAVTNAPRPESMADATYLTDATGQPYLPGSSLRGVLRHQALRIARTRGLAETVGVACFGTAKANTGRRGLVSVGDATLDGPCSTVVLNHVAIDRITGFSADAKLFSTVALASPKFKTRLLLKWHHDDANHRAAIALVLFVLRDAAGGLLWAGSRTTRGYGHMKGVGIESAQWSIVSQVDGQPPARTPGKADGPTVSDLAKELPELLTAWRELSKRTAVAS